MTQEQIVLYVGELDTPNWSFRFCGLTIEQVEKAAEAYWLDWMKKSGATWTWEFVSSSLMIYSISPGLAIRL